MLFNYLFSKYKNEIYEDIKDKKYARSKRVTLFFTIISFIGLTLFLIFGLLKLNVLTYISFGVFVIGILIVKILDNSKKEQKRLLKEVVEPFANNRFEKVVELLKEFKIDVTDEKEIDNLIERAEKEKLQMDLLKEIKKLFGGMVTYILLPIITILFSKAFEGQDFMILVENAMLIVVASAFVIWILAGWRSIIRDSISTNYRVIEHFISDIEDVKVFSNKAENYTSEIKSHENKDVETKEKGE